MSVRTKALRPDRRVERTRNALMASFVHLVLSEGYDAVSVERVAEGANVGRSTFYTHYSGKESMLRESLTRPSSHLAAIVGDAVSPDALVGLLRHFEGQKKTNRVFLEGRARALWVKCLAELILPRLTALSRNAHARPIVPLPFVAHQIAETQIALIAEWLSRRAAVKADIIADALIAVSNAVIASLLRIS
jgi:AcrR family transcriptional regulator